MMERRKEDIWCRIWVEKRGKELEKKGEGAGQRESDEGE